MNDKPESVYDNERLVSNYDKKQLADGHVKLMEQNQDLVYRLRERARIRRQIPGRKSVQENKPDRIADLLEEAAIEIEQLQRRVQHLKYGDPLDGPMIKMFRED